ncbi:uncharacterized protein LY89DRAFT_189536 [Mollisia scopiformis]|uniref:Uncharacterized protein n=1 Tax=Mollisia scopiformis TaxID=149040 RepID=A0A194XUD7_MOLSC|nr:uncharacterized protein LY89DRAFT_189536 [Mollisia scopiformis]KUJ23649.1 hypothetical protein LY89DRAFT_189536 [Mollisia scopiformis]
MLSCSSLSCNVWEAVKPGLKSVDELHLMELVSQGHFLRAMLEDWHERHVERLSNDPRDDPWLFLSSIYYHATSIYLSGIFDYRPQFDLLFPASLPFQIIQSHVTHLLIGIHTALDTTNLAGVLFFFPLRVAGARSWSEDQKLSILHMLKEISRRAYVVADAFVLDLNTLWAMDRNRENARRAWD